ncbi:MAG: hypothetical protein ACRDVL_11330 [Acidimicrobiia bacterium]
MRTLRIVVITVLAFGVLTGTAMAGGSRINAYRDAYGPGETVVMRGEVSPGQLGWVEDGPFYAYLRIDPLADRAAQSADRFPYIHETDLPLGQLEVTERSDGWVTVGITFTLPAGLPDGEHWVVYCNYPCTEGLGDLTGGIVKVATPRAPAPPRPASLVSFSPIHPV